MSNKTTRIEFLDAARGIAACLVLIFHATLKIVPNDVAQAYVYFDPGVVGVMLFFLVSGFVIPFSLERTGSIRNFAISRVFRIYPLYWFVFFVNLSLVFFGIVAGFSLVSGHLFEHGLTHLFFLQEWLPVRWINLHNLVGGSWTLAIEAVWYVLFALLYWLGAARRTVLVHAGANLVFLFVSLASIGLHMRLPLGKIGFLFTCFVGLYFYRYASGAISRRAFLVGAFASMANYLIALTVAFYLFSHPTHSFQSVLTSWSLGAAIFAFLFFMRNFLAKGVLPVFSYLGEISYSVYLIQGPVLVAVWWLLPKESYTVLVLDVVLVLILARMTFVLVEKRGIRLGKGLMRAIDARQSVRLAEARCPVSQ